MSVIEDWRTVRRYVADGAWPMPDRTLVAMLLTLEDKRFFRHGGVDWIALARAFTRYVLGRANGGASTIDMQLVRTLTGRRERTLRRKLRELALAMLVRRRFGARRVIGCYAARAFCGTGIIGFDAAAEALFDLPLARCDGRRKAIIAALPLHPAPADRNRRWRRVIVRRARRALEAAGLPDALHADRTMRFDRLRRWPVLWRSRDDSR